MNKSQKTTDTSMDNKKTTRTPVVRNEGEGSSTAARAYDSDVREFVKSGAVEGAAAKAKAAVDGPEGADLKKAERAGKRGKA